MRVEYTYRDVELTIVLLPIFTIGNRTTSASAVSSFEFLDLQLEFRSSIAQGLVFMSVLLQK